MTRPLRRLWSAAALAGFLGSGAPLDAQTPPPILLEADVDVVSVTAVVHDSAGRFVGGLGPKDVELFEDDVAQEVTYFREASADEPGERIPLSVVMVLDASGSMARNMRFLQEAAINFVRKLEEVDTALVVQFNEGIKGSAEFTNDVERLEQFVDALQAYGGTSLNDAIHYGLNRIRGQKGRKAVVVFSDGEDTTSQLKEQEVLDYARAVEASVYTIGIRGGPGGGSSPRGFLRKVAKETGGEFFFPERVGDLTKVFQAIADELHQHYLLAYSPKRGPDGTFRKITLRTKRKDLEVRVRQGYFAMKRPKPRPSPQD
ncbi:MAG: VWA domain-containing protein [Vicinamibacteria bacterium]